MSEKKPEILHAFDHYGDFIIRMYFAAQYHKLPSEIRLSIDMEDNKSNFDKVIDILDLDTYGLRLLKNRWYLTKNKGDKPEKDYVYQKIYQSDSVGLCMLVYLDGDELEIEVYYDQSAENLEDWVKAQLFEVRDAFGVEKSPVFRILKRHQGRFVTERVNLNFFSVDVAKMYNDDFVPVDREIKSAIENKQSGLILLFGKPGTGKTSYIKALISDYLDTKFIFVPNDFVSELLKPDFISFLIRQKDAVLVIEDAEKVVSSRENANEQSVVSTILQLTDGLFSDYLNIKVICTFNTDRSNIDKALFRKGRMIAYYEFRELDIAKTRQLLDDENAEVGEGLTLAEIYNRNKPDFESSQRKRIIGFRIDD